MTEVTLIRQNSDFTCGQACVAMIAGISLEQSIVLFGHAHATRTKEVIAVLRKLGFRTPDRLHIGPTKHRQGWASKSFGLFHVVWEQDVFIWRNGEPVPKKRRTGHWVVHNYGAVYDPLGVVVESLEEYEKQIVGRGRVLSGLNVFRSNDVRQ
jgi:hypothetical protein